MKKNICLFILITFCYVANAQEDSYLYGCENCTLSELIPFGDYKVVSYLEKSNANESKLMLLNKNNVGIDTVSGWLEGYIGMVKTGRNTFTSYGNSTVDFRIENQKIKIERAIGVRYFPKIKLEDMRIHHPLFFWEDYVFTPFYNDSFKGNTKKGKISIKTMQYALMSTRELKSNPDRTASWSIYYGGRVPLESNYILDGKDKNPKWNFIPISEKEVFDNAKWTRTRVAKSDLGLLVLNPMSNRLLFLQKEGEEVKVKKITLNVDPKKHKISKVFSDVINGKNYLLSINVAGNHYEIWELGKDMKLYQTLGKTSYLPYHLENGYYYVRVVKDKRVDILKIPLE